MPDGEQPSAPVDQIRTFLRNADENGAHPESLRDAAEAMRRGIDFMSERNVGIKVVGTNGETAIIIPVPSPASISGPSKNEHTNQYVDDETRTRPTGAVFIADTGEIALVQPAESFVDQNRGTRGGQPIIEKVAITSDAQYKAFQGWLAAGNGTLLPPNEKNLSFLAAFRAFIGTNGIVRLTHSSAQATGENDRAFLSDQVDAALMVAESRLTWKEQSRQRDGANAEDVERSRNAFLLANAGKVQAMVGRIAALQPQAPPDPTSPQG